MCLNSGFIKLCAHTAWWQHFVGMLHITVHSQVHDTDISKQFHFILWTNSDYYPHNINRLLFTTQLHGLLWIRNYVHTTRTEVFLSSKPNARVQLAKTGHGPHSSQLGDNFYVFIYLLYYIIPSTQHNSLSYRYMFRLNKSSSGVSKNQN